jgi:capsid protein
LWVFTSDRYSSQLNETKESYKGFKGLRKFLL